jgi:hypothetical protein
MAFSPTALEATLTMEDPTVKQGTPHDLRRIGQLADEPLTRLQNLLVFHHT